uniref:Sfi1 spindle body domain-containing protein n=1 Tax=Guillardia theta TaxID=55529 RepID=A0A7S4KXI4_GUITH
MFEDKRQLALNKVFECIDSLNSMQRLLEQGRKHGSQFWMVKMRTEELDHHMNLTLDLQRSLVDLIDDMRGEILDLDEAHSNQMMRCVRLEAKVHMLQTRLDMLQLGGVKLVMRNISKLSKHTLSSCLRSWAEVCMRRDHLLRSRSLSRTEREKSSIFASWKEFCRTRRRILRKKMLTSQRREAALVTQCFREMKEVYQRKHLKRIQYVLLQSRHEEFDLLTAESTFYRWLKLHLRCQRKQSQARLADTFLRSRSLHLRMSTILRRWCRESSHNIFLKRHFQYLERKRNRRRLSYGFNILHAFLNVQENCDKKIVLASSGPRGNERQAESSCQVSFQWRDSKDIRLLKENKLKRSRNNKLRREVLRAWWAAVRGRRGFKERASRIVEWRRSVRVYRRKQLILRELSEHAQGNLVARERGKAAEESRQEAEELQKQLDEWKAENRMLRQGMENLHHFHLKHSCSLYANLRGQLKLCFFFYSWALSCTKKKLRRSCKGGGASETRAVWRPTSAHPYLSSSLSSPTRVERSRTSPVRRSPLLQRS